MASKNIDGTTGPLLTPIENADSYAWFVVVGATETPGDTAQG